MSPPQFRARSRLTLLTRAASVCLAALCVLLALIIPPAARKSTAAPRGVSPLRGVSSVPGISDVPGVPGTPGFGGLPGASGLPGREPENRATILSNFDSGQVQLISSDPSQDQEPNAWELTQDNAYGGSGWSLRLFGNTWKAQEINPYAITRGSVFRAAVYVEQKGEMQAFGVSDGTNTLYYTLAGTELPTSPPWEVTYQGAFPIEQWQVYMLPVGRDWFIRFGYEPNLTRLIFVNDRDLSTHGITLFDDIVDVTSDLPIAPQVQIVRGRQSIEKLARNLYRIGIQFHAQVYDPDSDSLMYYWDFGDSTQSNVPDPYHEFLVQADYTYTVTLGVRDESGQWGRDSMQVQVDPGMPELPLTMNFAGDVMLARGYDAPGGLIDTYGPEYIFTPTRAIYGEDAAVNVCNLECPFTDRGTPHPTKSVVFRARPDNIAGVVYAGIDLVSLGNNHIIDYGQPGLDQTLDILDSVQVRWSGAGDDEYRALQPSFWTEQGVALAFVQECNRTGREYNYQPFLDAAYNKPGFAYLTESNMVDAIHAVRPLADLVITQFHAGIEYTTGPGNKCDPLGKDPAVTLAELADAEGPFPSQPVFHFPTRPTLTDRQLRWRAVEEGANLVICHHPHVLQGFEVYQGVVVVHSLGNFVFDQSYAETFPSIVLKTEFYKNGFTAFTFRPVFLDNLVPRPATGRLGREILDRMADYSRELNTLVTVDPTTMQGQIHPEPASVIWNPVTQARTAAVQPEDATWISAPIERDGPGVLARILAAAPDGAVQIRVGREILWHGDMEDEGATMWDLNSSSETYDTSIYHQGLRSLRQKRTFENSGPVTTDLEGFPPTLGGTEFSLCGWIRTSNASDAGFAARFFAGRGGNPIATEEAGDLVNGTHDWTWMGRDFTVPEEAAFFNLRPHLERPSSGEAFVWYDELRLIEWEPWQDAVFPLDLPRPSNLRFLQVRLNQSMDSVRVTWEDAEPEMMPVGLAQQTGVGVDRIFLAPPAPNPFRGQAVIEYRLARAEQVRLEIFDVGGRRMASLWNGRLAAGSHRSVWEPQGIPAGMYFCRLEAGGVVRTNKLVVVR